MARDQRQRLRRKGQRVGVEDALKSRPPRLPKTTSYVIEISEWNWHYSFGVERSGLRNQGMIEGRAFFMSGILTAPLTGNEEVWAILSPDCQLDQVHLISRQPVGTLRLTNKGIEAFLYFPSTSVGPILQMMLAGQFTQLSIDATAFKLNEADVLSFGLRR